VHNDSVGDYQNLLSELGVPDGNLTTGARDAIASEFGESTATLAGWGGVDGVRILREQVSQAEANADAARQAGNEATASAFDAQAASLRDGLNIAGGVGEIASF
jgi:hypothetical protein